LSSKFIAARSNKKVTGFGIQGRPEKRATGTDTVFGLPRISSPESRILNPESRSTHYPGGRMGPATETGRPVLLCGLGRVGWRVLASLRAAGLPVVVVDTNLPADDPRLAGLTAVKGDCRRPEVLERAGVRDARGVLIVTSDDLVNVSAALLVRKLNPDARVVVRMFNQNLLARFGTAVRNTVALSVSALTAPLLALTAATGDAIGAFKLDTGPQQVSELTVTGDSELAGRKLGDVAGEHRLTPIALIPAGGPLRFLLDVRGDTPLSPGDRLVVAGSPANLRPLLARARGEILPGVRWAGAIRRWVRTAHRTFAEIDLSVKIATAVLVLTLLVGTLVFRYGLDAAWGDAIYQTVSIAATGTDMHGENRPEWAKVFLSILKLAGAAMIAGFTAIFTNYLIRARLGGALEVRRLPDGGHVVVCGLGNVGYRCVEELAAIGERVVAIDRTNDNPFIATCRRKGIPTFVGDATVGEVLRQARADTAKAVVAATSSELANLEIALLVRDLNPALRVVVRLSDPQFADAVREAAEIRYAVSVPALAAPAFAAALFGDRVQTLITAAGRTLAVVEFVVQPDDPCLGGRSLRAAVTDYRFLPVAVGSRDPAAVPDHRLRPGDRLTAVLELPDLERVLRRESVPHDHAVIVDAFPVTAKEVLIPLVRTTRRCDQDGAEKVLAALPFTLADGLTRGEAEDLLAQVSRERVTARMVSANGPA
jgi:Trk K+ transport system NAD-binding subunit